MNTCPRQNALFWRVFTLSTGTAAMLIRFGLGGQLSGSVGGVVAGHNKGGQYLRNRSIPTNPNSVRQQTARVAFANASIEWKSLTNAERTAWEAYAVGTPIQNRLGETITLSGFNHFLKTNAFRQNCGEASLNTAPISPGLTSLGGILGASLSAATGMTFVTSAATAVGPRFASIGPPQSAGVTAFRGPYTLFSVADTMGTSGFGPAAGPFIPGRYGAPVVGERRPLRIAGSGTEGALSNIFETIVVVGA